NPIYGIGGSAASPLIARVAAHLAGATPPITVVYASPGACYAMTALVPTGAPVTPLASAGTTVFNYWTADDPTKAKTCTISATSNITASWGSMAQLPDTCQGITTLPADVGDFIGPISGLSLIVPLASTEQSISAEAVYYIYGFGAGTNHDVAPWTIPGAIGTRNRTSAVGLLLAKAVGLPASANLQGAVDVTGNSQAVQFVTGSFTDKTGTSYTAPATNPSAALAFCSTETADAQRALVRTLAFKAPGQDCAYSPDSEFTGTNSTDKKNLREGRYFLWNPHHFYAKVDPTTKKVVDPNLAKFIDIMTSTADLPASTTADSTPTFLDLQIKNGNVPQCAMHVTRTGDVGPLSSFQPDKSCSCYFDYKTTNSTSCKACSANTDCPASASSCNYGFCEVK
ncbi:MAG: hypothetical protein JWN04_5286, partial [Myxococcaceae bacterium]|nr:hypothetical protein [Myxococcaceae bacterium]